MSEGAKGDSLLQNVQTVFDDHSGSYATGTLGSILGGKTAAQYSYSVDVKKGYSYTCTPPARLQCVNRGNFTFLTATNAVNYTYSFGGAGKLKGLQWVMLLAPTGDTVNTHILLMKGISR